MAIHQRAEKHDVPEEAHVHRIGDWLSSDHRINQEWLGGQIEHVKKNPKPLSPALQEFKDFIENTPRVYMWFHSMFNEVPVKAPYNKDPTGKKKQIRDYKHMLEVLNHVFTQAPHWTDSAYHVGMVGVPVNAVLNYPMGTASGYAAFLDPEVNAHIKKVLNEWGKFLASPKSAEVLGTHTQGWFSQHGTEDVMQVANAPHKTSHTFDTFFVCDPSAKHHGYKSWDDYFTRKFRPEVRPIEGENDDNIIISACESKPFQLQHNAHLRDKFWIKGQPYSVLDMLAHDPLAQEFAGATVYQAFLSALSYHRWHMPVSGTIKKAYVVDGTYFSEPLWEGLGDRDTENIAPNGIAVCQGYLSALAARAIIFIEADNPAIGLMAFIGIGMDEVSTCDITAKEGQHYKKGEETGMFHFGGSTHCLLFRKGVKVEGFPEPGRSENVPVRSKIATVTA